MSREHERLVELAVDEHWAGGGRARAVRAVRELIADGAVVALFASCRDEPLAFLDRLQAVSHCSSDVAEVVYTVLASLPEHDPVEV